MNIPEWQIVGDNKHLDIVIRQCVHRGFVTFDDAIQIHKHLPHLRLPLKVSQLDGKMTPKTLERLLTIFS